MIEIKGHILNASGCWCDTREKIIELSNSQLSGVVSKTCTKMPKMGNPEPNYYYIQEDGIHFNSKGLPNYGYEYYKECFSLVSEKNKPFILSVAYNEHELNDFTWILKDYDGFLQQHEKDALIEINISCPNIHSRIPGYHKKDIAFLIQHIRTLHLTRVKIGLKLPPYFELEKIRKIAELFLLHTDIIAFIVCCNTIPNAYYDGKYNGVSGKINKYVSLGNIKKFKEYFSDKIHIIGSGGITNEQDIQDYLNAGANLVQLGSGFYDKERNALDCDKINGLMTEQSSV